MSEASPLPKISITDDCNYIAAFLTFACTYKCHYCINSFENSISRRHKILRVDQWITALHRLDNLEHPDGLVPVTLQGGEPSCHPDFYQIINGLPERIRIDILTNLSFDAEEMIARIQPDRLRRDAPYASIRVSYHPDQVAFDELLERTLQLQDAGFSIGIWAVLHPDQVDLVLAAQQRAQKAGIDFRTKEFLGFHKGQLHGNYLYDDACTMEKSQTVSCRTTELIIGPDGNVYRCHHDLYENYPPIGNILDSDFRMDGRYRSCDYFGYCNPCDVKIKTNRHQQFGHTSVSIKFPQSNQTSPSHREVEAVR